MNLPSKRIPTSLDLKIVVLGPAGVGKTCVIHRYCNQTFLTTTLATIGAGFFPKTIRIDGCEVNMMIWDTAGEERFRSVAPSLLRGANGLILVFDVTFAPSLDELEAYLNMFLETVDYDQTLPLPVLLLGNKGDIEEKAVTEEMINDWKTNHNIPNSVIVSAKTGNNINEAFETFISNFVHTPNEPEKSFNQILIKPMETKPKEKGCC